MVMTILRRFEISPRPPELGSGWRLQLFQDGIEVGGGVFPPISHFLAQKLAEGAAYENAYAEGAAWIETP